MKTLLKWLARVLLVLVVLAIVTGGYIYLRFGQSLPQTSGEMQLSGLQSETSIVRDKYGIAHIFASSNHDLFFTMGVAHAQDRMFQMDLSRRAAHGRLSELVGSLTLRTDVQMRVLGLGEAADESFKHFNRKTQDAFQAYAKGVNSIIAAKGYVPPPEYTLLMTRPEPWRAQDSAAVLKMMAFGLSGDALQEPKLAKLLEIIGKEKAAQFLAPYPDDAPVTLSENDLGLSQDSMPVTDEPDYSAVGGEPPKGSNNWVVSGGLTASGKPLLANDPHLLLSTPGVWYFARMQMHDAMMLGATIPGTPFVTLGRNATAAWGFTNTGPDTSDLFVYDKSDVVTTDTKSLIKVRWGKDLPITISRNEQGPVLDPNWFDLGDMAKDGEVVVIQSTLDDWDDTTGELGVALMDAETFPDFVAGLQSYKMPQQNMVFADANDNIGFIAPARVPVRDESGNWISEIPFDELPVSSNSERQYYASANNKIVPDSYPHFITSSWYGFHRVRRIVELIEQTELHDKRSFSRMQMDTVSDLARLAIPLIASSEPQTSAGKELRLLLGGWDGNLAADRPEGLIYSMWMRNFTKGLYSDDLGDDFEQFWAARREFVDGVFAGQYAAWCDDIRTNEMESCQQVAGISLDQVAQQLADTSKSAIQQLQWGERHQAKFAHPLFDNTPLGRFFSVKVPVGGDASTINVAHTDYNSGNFDVLWGASMRAIYDFSDIDSSLFMHAPGQSGNVMSPHYSDLLQAWADGEFFEIRSDWTELSPPPNSQTLTLKPQ
ncbi:MAG: penicillin acylase family protein [Robiginitomaculum sp.]|nr:penicillin acylase family protein [Robiginitomaculum sp.]